MQRWPDVARLGIAIVHTERQDQADLGDEQDPEEECESAQRFLPALFERLVVDFVDHTPEHEEDRHHHQANDDRIDAERAVYDVGEIRAQDNERRMRDIDDVEHSERDRDADGHGDIEAAEEHARHDRVDQQLNWKIHTPPWTVSNSNPPARWRLVVAVFLACSQRRASAQFGPTPAPQLTPLI